MADRIGCEAKFYLDKMPRIYRYQEHEKYQEHVFLLPQGIDYDVNENTEITTRGLSPELDRKTRDLINVIVSEDPLRMKFRRTNVLTPLMYAESLPDILWHITTQALLFTRVTNELLSWIRDAETKVDYGKHSMDYLWLSCSKTLDDVCPGDYICVFNRRVAGWDGSHDRPVIELLGTGGHLPTIWDKGKKTFRMLSFEENLQKEAEEELALSFRPEDIHIFGGYNNEVTHEMVVLAGIEIPADKIPEMEDYAIKNIDPDTMGIYLGTFSEVMSYYRKDPVYFAGGERAAGTNFPHQIELMTIIENWFAKKGVIRAE